MPTCNQKQLCRHLLREELPIDIVEAAEGQVAELGECARGEVKVPGGAGGTTLDNHSIDGPALV